MTENCSIHSLLLEVAPDALCDDCIVTLLGFDEQDSKDEVLSRLAEQAEIERIHAKCFSCEAEKGVTRAISSAESNQVEIEINAEFARALELINGGEPLLFVTGRAGTGKSTLLKLFQREVKGNVVFLAPTGIAALNIDGQTIHRFFGFGITATPEGVRASKARPRNPELFQSLDTIVIDEVSMLRADLLDCIEEFLSKHGPRPSQPFGGVQMIFVGDLYQLPPVVTDDLREYFQQYYHSPYFFSSRALARRPELVELKRVYRQRDSDFIDLLSRVREGTVTERDMDLVNRRVNPSFQPSEADFHFTLTTTNRAADRINAENLSRLPGSVLVVDAEQQGEVNSTYLPTEVQLAFKPSAQVMMVNNDHEGRWVNGDIGTVKAFSRCNGELDFVRIELRDQTKPVDVSRHVWELVAFTYKKGRIVSRPAGRFAQFPFRLAWAVTIHKSQGKTFDNLIVDLDRGTFAHGQLYVALSRCTSLEGITLRQPLTRADIQVNPLIGSWLSGKDIERPLPPPPIVNPRVLRLMECDERDTQLEHGNLRLACLVYGGGKVVIWGDPGNRRNIDSVLGAGFPCIVEADWRSPTESAKRYGVTHWVAQNAYLKVFSDQ